MFRLLIGAVLLVGGIVMLVYGLYYGSVLGTPDLGPAVRSRYEFLSSAFGILTYCFVGAGVITIAMAIRKMNADYKKERSQLPTGSDGPKRV
jgi:uncharacterized MnhB-related membrane protein